MNLHSCNRFPPDRSTSSGDIHGEIEPLRRLLRALGYDKRGTHADNRTLVFVGDLADRGPDSVSVVLLCATCANVGGGVSPAITSSICCVEQKDGNGWAFTDNHDRKKGSYLHSRDANAEKRCFVNFFAELPLALYRDDLRIMHACWDDELLSRIVASGASRLREVFEHFDALTARQLGELELLERSRAEQRAHDLTNAGTMRLC